jgi:S-adenosylmethionine/arginine decarboxylase-like enzyme
MPMTLALEHSLPPETRGNSLHLLVDWWACSGARLMLDSSPHVREVCVKAMEATGARVLGEYFHELERGGVAGVVLLASAHMAIRTWPGRRAVTLDLVTYGEHDDNPNRARRLASALRDAYRPAREYVLEIARG